MPDPPNRFLSLLARGAPIVAGGPMGTRLGALGLPAGDAPRRWVLEPKRRAAGRAVHRPPRDAGSQILLTDTFGTNPTRLTRHGLAERVDEVNRTAARLARQEAGANAVVAGPINPTGDSLEPPGTLPPVAAAAGFARQAAALVEGGVDVLRIETMADLAEVQVTVLGARQGSPGLPIVVTMAFGAGRTTVMGFRPAEVIVALTELHVAAAGTNCGTGSPAVERALAAMHATIPELPLIGKPTGDIRHVEGGVTVCPKPPVDLAAATRGVCCGGTPERVRAIAVAIAALPAHRRWISSTSIARMTSSSYVIARR